MSEVTRVGPLFGWRKMILGIDEDGPYLGGLYHSASKLRNAVSEPAQCYPPRKDGRGTKKSRVLHESESPHSQDECPSVKAQKPSYLPARSGYPACGHYAYYEPNLKHSTYRTSYWAFVQAIGKTWLHETGFRTQRYFVKAIFAGYIDTGGTLCEITKALDIPLLSPDASVGQLVELGIPIHQARLLQQPKQQDYFVPSSPIWWPTSPPQFTYDSSLTTGNWYFVTNDDQSKQGS